jgi:hypothetical protein
MADEEPDFDDLVDEEYIPVYPWSKDHVTLDALELAADIAESTATYLRKVSTRAGADSNNNIDRRDMQVKAAKEIERMLSESEE